MIKLKDLIDGGSSAPKRVDESLAMNERPADDAGLSKDSKGLLLLRKNIIQAMGQSLDLGNQGYQMTLITNNLAAANKALNILQRKSKQKNEVGVASQSMTRDEENRLISKIHKLSSDRLTRMLQSAAKEANRGDARSQDLARIYHNELNNRHRMGYGGL